MSDKSQALTEYEKGMLVIDYFQELGMANVAILDAVCDENLETSYRVIVENPNATKEEILTLIGITEN